MADKEEDFSSLSLVDRFSHKLWKVRKEAYEEAAKQFELTPDESDPAFRPFLQDPSLWKGAVADANVAAQQEGVAALVAFLKFGGREACVRTRGSTITGALVEKGLASTRAATKASATEALLLYIELDVAAPVVEDMLPALAAKQPKVVAATLAALTTVYHVYGCKTADPKPVLKLLPKAFGHADKNVRAEATRLAVELYRWLRDAMKPMFWGDLKPTQQTELDAQFDAIKAANDVPKQERLLRSQQAARAKAAPPGAGADWDGDGDGADGGDDDDGPAEVDAFDLAEPQDVLRSVPADFHDKLASAKWKDRKEAVDALYAVLNVPRIKDGDFGEINRGLAKCMKDANIAVVTQAALCIDVLARGMRRAYGKYRPVVMQPILERLKEKKASVSDALGVALDAVFLATDLSECLEDIVTYLAHKNPQVKESTMRFLIRCLRTTRDVPSKQEINTIVEAAKKLLAESSEGLRSGGAEVLGTVMKIVGERAMNPHLEGLDDIRKTKIKEFYETAEVKAKEKPKAAKPPPPKSAAAAGPPKKVMGGGAAAGGLRKGPSPKKRVGAPVTASHSEPPPPAAAPPTARPGVAGVSRLGGGLKAPQKRTLAGPGALSPRRVPPSQSVSPPPMDDDEPAAVPTTPAAQPRLGMGRGGLAGRSLAKPTSSLAASAAAAQQQQQQYQQAEAPASPTAMSGLTALERAEMDELRASNYRLLRQAEEARHERAKMVSEIQELKNQNAGLIEDHTRDVLSIKAKETQLVRARSDAEAAEQTNERLRRELDRLKRALSKAEAALGLGGSGSGDGMASPSPRFASPTHDDVGIYRDNGAATASGYPLSTHRGSGSHQQQQQQQQQQRMSFVSTLSEEKENGLGGRGSPARGFRRDHKMGPSTTTDDGGDGAYGSYGGGGGGGAGGAGEGGGGHVTGQESWKRAAEVTTQLKARIELMKAKQGIRRG